MENVVSNIEETFARLIGILSDFDQNQIDKIPFEGSWTAGQVGEHLVKGLSGMPRLVAGKTQKTNRPYDAKVKTIRDMFLDFDNKMTAPDFLVPTEKHHAKEALIEALQNIESELLAIAKKEDLSITCLGFELPGYGPMTVYEWIAFTTAHAQRHTLQLEKIHARLN